MTICITERDDGAGDRRAIGARHEAVQDRATGERWHREQRRGKRGPCGVMLEIVHSSTPMAGHGVSQRWPLRSSHSCVRRIPSATVTRGT
jgi:hypothetical protein